MDSFAVEDRPEHLNHIERRTGVVCMTAHRDHMTAAEAAERASIAAHHLARTAHARRHRTTHRNHMAVPWHEVLDEADTLAIDAPLADKSSIICRAGSLLLAGGTGSWRVRQSMNRIARVLGVTCTADVSLTHIECTCIDDREHGTFSEVVSLPGTGVNTERIWYMEKFVKEVQVLGAELTVGAWHRLMDKVEHERGHYAPWQMGLASAAACCAFVFLLGGGPIEMGCAFVGAGLGNFVRSLLGRRKLMHLVGIAVSVAVACIAYLASLTLLGAFVPDAMDHEAGYIGAMLFVIPGFPLITSGLDIAKLDYRSGIERLFHAGTIIISATLVGWLVASAVQLKPDDFAPLGLSFGMLAILRLLASFVGVFGFSMMFNSPYKMCLVAAVNGAVANTLRLTLADFGMPPEAAAFTGALASGLLASAACLRFGFPRIGLTVPSIVIMVPGLYMYRAMFYMGIFDTLNALSWTIRAIMIVMCLPMGLGVARALTDAGWRHAN